MFGEEPIVGKYEYKIDPKGRVFIPSIPTKVEEGELLVSRIFDEENGKILRVYSKAIYDILKERMLEANSSKSLDEFDELNAKIALIATKIAATHIVDPQKRITIPKWIIDELGWETNSTILLQGEGNSLKLYQNKNNSR